MTRVITDEQNYYDIAEAIRGKLDVETLYLPSEMAAAIETIETGTELTSEDEGKVVVEDAGSYVLAAQTSMNISENGTYDTTTNDEVVVAVQGGGGGGGTLLAGIYAPSSDYGSDGNVYLRYIGASEEVPQGYEAIQSLAVDSTSGPYIDTGFYANQANGYEIAFRYSGTPDNDTWFFGAYQSNKDTMIGYYNSRIRANVGNGGAYEVPIDTNIHLVTVTENAMYFDGTNTGKTVNWSNAPAITMQVFSDHAHTPSKYVEVFFVNIYSNGSLVRKMVPCKRTSDDVLGMYDLINDVFYTNAGSGSFTQGSEGGDVISAYAKVNGAWQGLMDTNIEDIDLSGGGGTTNVLKMAEQPSDSVGSDGVICLLYNDYKLPDGYTKLEYLEVGSQSGPYIQTGYMFSSDSEYEIGFQYTNTPTSNSMLFGASYPNKETTIVYTQNKVWAQAGSSNYQFNRDNLAHDVAVTSSKIVVDGVEHNSPNWSNAPNQEAYVFYASNSSGSKANNVRVFYVKLYRAGVLETCLVPCIRTSDNELGMYDTIGNAFHANSGTGSFTAGQVDTVADIYDVLLKVNGSWVPIEGQDVDDVGSN